MAETLAHTYRLAPSGDLDHLDGLQNISLVLYIDDILISQMSQKLAAHQKL